MKIIISRNLVLSTNTVLTCAFLRVKAAIKTLMVVIAGLSSLCSGPALPSNEFLTKLTRTHFRSDNSSFIDGEKREHSLDDSIHPKKSWPSSVKAMIRKET